MRISIKVIFFIQLLIVTGRVCAQNDQAYDEIVITLNVQRIGSVDMPAVIYEESAYLSIKDVFDFLKIKNTLSANYDSISGFIMKPSALFVIRNYQKNITYSGKTYKLKEKDLIKTDNSLFLKTDVFGEVFGLDCKFDFRSLSVVMKSRIELPSLVEMQQQQMRRNISQLKGEKKADTTISKKLPVFALGSADWSVYSTQEVKGNSNTRINLNLGGIIAGGEATAFLNYTNNAPFNKERQYYRWRYVNNDQKMLKQVSLGNVYVQSTSTINSAMNGVQFTNTPTSYKKSFGNYTISNKTDPDWTVELYINNVLINYVKADASGFYSFEVPIVYGTSIIKLRHISPWGEERVVEEQINIPYNFVSAGQLEYMVTAGVVRDDSQSKFSRVNFSYGLNNRVTIGGGMEYMSSLKEDKMPFVNASIRVGSNIVLSGEHSYKVRSRGVLTYKLPSNLQFELTYVKYDPSQQAVRTNFLVEKKAVLLFPYRTKKFSSFYRFTFNEVNLLKSKLTNAEFLVSAAFAGISSNLTTYAVYSPSEKARMYSNMSFTVKLPKGIRLSPQIQYEYTTNQVNMVRCEVDKNISRHGSISLSNDRFITSKNHVTNLAFRYNFSAAQTLSSIRTSNTSTMLTQSARGSIMYAGKANGIKVSNSNTVGRGGLVLKAFLDLNNNGKRDNDEPAAKGLKFDIRAGVVSHNMKDTSSTVSGLEAFASYLVTLDKHCFENISWQITKPTMSVTVEPNHYKLIEIPVTVFGEISGMVYLDDTTGRKGLGRMIINIYDKDQKLAAKVLSEQDGYFNHIGLLPGLYTASIEEAQLNKLNLSSAPKLKFALKVSKEGDIVNSLNILLKPKVNKTGVK